MLVGLREDATVEARVNSLEELVDDERIARDADLLLIAARNETLPVEVVEVTNHEALLAEAHLGVMRVLDLLLGVRLLLSAENDETEGLLDLVLILIIGKQDEEVEGGVERGLIILDREFSTDKALGVRDGHATGGDEELGSEGLELLLVVDEGLELMVDLASLGLALKGTGLELLASNRIGQSPDSTLTAAAGGQGGNEILSLVATEVLVQLLLGSSSDELGGTEGRHDGLRE
jgi:hypothetical protein